MAREDRSARAPALRQAVALWTKRLKFIVMLALLAAVLVLICKNNSQAELWVFGYRVKEPLMLWLLLSFGAGGVAGILAARALSGRKR